MSSPSSCLCCSDTKHTSTPHTRTRTRSKARPRARPRTNSPSSPAVPDTIPVIDGDLLTIDYGDGEYMVHQTNCESKRAAGIASDIFKMYPDANTYKASAVRVPGTISVHHPVINLYGQQKPGKARSAAKRKERLEWFRSGLDAIAEIDDIETLYIPYNIGSGMAGGVWPAYLKAITDWSNGPGEDIVVIIVKK